eukprot:m51a1_g12299 putative protein serine threonine kinase (1342) ;mRNA; r:326891-332659
MASSPRSTAAVVVVQGDLSTLGKKLTAAEANARERRHLFSLSLASDPPKKRDVSPLATIAGQQKPSKDKKKKHSSGSSKDKKKEQDKRKEERKEKEREANRHSSKSREEPKKASPSIVRSLFSLLPGELDFTKKKVPGITDLTDVPMERALRHNYDAETVSWSRTPVLVKIDPYPFAAGGMRRAHYMQIWEAVPGTWSPVTAGEGDTCVAKFIHSGVAENAVQLRAMYFQDVEQQMIAKFYAAKYNKYGPPKKVDFVEASLMELLDREGGPDVRLCGVEKYIFGHYCKWNNNCGYVHENTRNTPQAFSHFTYEASKHTILVCDIQGVGDIYTDPVIHTSDTAGSELFSGNLGLVGIEQFLISHKCNPLCKTLGLPPIRPEDSGAGTRFENGAEVEITRRTLLVDKLGQVPAKFAASKAEIQPSESQTDADDLDLSSEAAVCGSPPAPIVKTASVPAGLVAVRDAESLSAQVLQAKHARDASLPVLASPSGSEVVRTPFGSFTMGLRIGRGAFAHVYRARWNETGVEVAVKKFASGIMAPATLESVMKEVKLQSGLSHPNIIRIYGHHFESASLFLFLEYAECGSLMKFRKQVGKLSEEVIALFVEDILCALSYLHSNGIAHRDLKATNVLLTRDGTAKLADFGVAAVISDTDKHFTLVGSPYWMAPEIITEVGHSISSDIWSLGCTIHELMKGDPPFFGINPMAAMFKISQGPPPIPSEASAVLRTFLEACFEKDPARRPSATQLQSHAWLDILLGDKRAKAKQLVLSVVCKDGSLPTPPSSPRQPPAFQDVVVAEPETPTPKKHSHSKSGGGSARKRSGSSGASLSPKTARKSVSPPRENSGTVDLLTALTSPDPDECDARTVHRKHQLSLCSRPLTSTPIAVSPRDRLSLSSPVGSPGELRSVSSPKQHSYTHMWLSDGTASSPTGAKPLQDPRVVSGLVSPKSSSLSMAFCLSSETRIRSHSMREIDAKKEAVPAEDTSAAREAELLAELQELKARLAQLELETAPMRGLKARIVQDLSLSVVEAAPTMRVWSAICVAGSVWVGGSDGIVSVYGAVSCEFGCMVRLHRGRVYSMVHLGERVWCSSEDGGVYVASASQPREYRRTHVHDDDHPVIRCLTPVRHGSRQRVWSCAPGLLDTQVVVLSDRARQKNSFVVRHPVHCAVQAAPRAVWMGCSGFVLVCDVSSGAATREIELPEAARGTKVAHMLCVGDLVWAAAGAQVVVFDQAGNAVALLAQAADVGSLCQLNNFTLVGDSSGRVGCYDSIRCSCVHTLECPLFADPGGQAAKSSVKALAAAEVGADVAVWVGSPFTNKLCVWRLPSAAKHVPMLRESLDMLPL